MPAEISRVSPALSVASKAARWRSRRTISPMASFARGSAKACLTSGRRSAEPAYAPMNVGTCERLRSGYIRHRPTESTKATASSMVRTGLPSVCQRYERCCWSSSSVISDTFKRFLNLLHRIAQYHGTAMRTAHGTLGPGQYLQQPLHFFLLQRHVDLDGGMAGDRGRDPRPDGVQVKRLLLFLELVEQFHQHLLHLRRLDACGRSLHRHGLHAEKLYLEAVAAKLVGDLGE